MAVPGVTMKTSSSTTTSSQRLMRRRLVNRMLRVGKLKMLMSSENLIITTKSKRDKSFKSEN